MKKMELRRVPYGTAFQAFGDEFVALDYINGGVLAIRRDIWKNAAFDDNGVNDLRGASITDGLAEYLRKLMDGGADGGDILEMSIDLKAVDGTREYGRYDTCVGLLTLEQYGKYQHIIPDVDGPWWLATPWRTPGEKFGGAASALLRQREWLLGPQLLLQRWLCHSSGFALFLFPLSLYRGRGSG